MTSIAPIGPVRVAAVRPIQPGPDDDPSEDGLGVEAVMEPTMAAVTDRIAPTADAGDAQLDLSHRAYAANAAATVSGIAALQQAHVPNHNARGNVSVPTGFDSRPASSSYDMPRGNFATPFARAMSAYSAG